VNETAIGVDIGGSHVKFGIVREDRVVAAETLAVKDASLEPVLRELEVGIPALAEKCGIKLQSLAGVAVGICAIVDGADAVFATNGKYDDGVGLSFARWAEDKFGLPCRAQNDARLALLGEHFAGAARGFDDAVLVTIGTGIGGAVMLGGRLLRSGGHKAGGLAGHLGVAWNGRLCSCGNRGCAEAEASTASLDAICRESPGFAASVLASVSRRIDFELLFQAADAGDAFACEVLDRCIGVWSALTVSLVHAYDPKVIVFGGGVMQRQEAILPRIREHVDQFAWAEQGSVAIVPSTLGSSAALLGALPLLRGEG
jgi:glucokinase